MPLLPVSSCLTRAQRNINQIFRPFPQYGDFNRKITRSPRIALATQRTRANPRRRATRRCIRRRRTKPTETTRIVAGVLL